MAKTKHRRRRGAFLFGCVLAITALASALWLRSDPFPRLEVAGFRISQEEYLRVMHQARRDVLSDHAAAGISLTDWNTETPLGDPVGLTTERALTLLKEYYAVGTLAVERGDLADAGYDAMLRQLEALNHQRQEALQNGEPLTGIPSFSVDDYITYRAAGLRLQFCTDPDNPENQISPEEILRRYEADRDALYRQPDSMELAFLVSDGASEALEADFRALRQTALELGGLSPALELHPALKGCYQEISVHPGTYGFHQRTNGDVLNWAEGLQPGEISQVLRQEDRICLVECRERTAHQYVPLEDVQSVVEQSIRESRYDDLIAARMDSMQITGDLQQLHRFTAAQIS
jgi:hypothetical protein